MLHVSLSFSYKFSDHPSTWFTSSTLRYVMFYFFWDFPNRMRKLQASSQKNFFLSHRDWTHDHCPTKPIIEFHDREHWDGQLMGQMIYWNSFEHREIIKQKPFRDHTWLYSSGNCFFEMNNSRSANGFCARCLPLIRRERVCIANNKNSLETSLINHSLMCNYDVHIK